MDKNELIEKFWIEHGGKAHMKEDLWFYENDLTMLMPVLEKIHQSKSYDDRFSSNNEVGVEVNVSISRGRFSCYIELPDTSDGYDYVEGCYYNEPLFKIYAVDVSIARAVYSAVVGYIEWFYQQKENEN